MADLKQASSFAGIQITGGPLLGPQNIINATSGNTNQTNFVSGGGTSDDIQYIGDFRVIYKV